MSTANRLSAKYSQNMFEIPRINKVKKVHFVTLTGIMKTNQMKLKMVEKKYKKNKSVDTTQKEV